MKNQNGFTLIELLVVVLIIGILAAVALPTYKMAVDKARIKGELPLVRAVVNALKVYYMANSSYPVTLEELEGLDVSFPEGGEKRYDEQNDMEIIYANKHIRFVVGAGRGLAYVQYDSPEEGNLQLLMATEEYSDTHENYVKPGEALCSYTVGTSGEKICRSLCYSAPRNHAAEKVCDVRL